MVYSATRMGILFVVMLVVFVGTGSEDRQTAGDYCSLSVLESM